jgi:hypothetical protein
MTPGRLRCGSFAMRPASGAGQTSIGRCAIKSWSIVPAEENLLGLLESHLRQSLPRRGADSRFLCQLSQLTPLTVLRPIV